LRGVLIAVAWTLFCTGLAVIVDRTEPAHAEIAIATWYGTENGSETSSGERFDPEGACADTPQHSCTCAHRSLPFGTQLRVTWRGRSIVCRVTDRGPNIRTGADLDLSKSAGAALGLLEAGRARVQVEPVGRLE